MEDANHEIIRRINHLKNILENADMDGIDEPLLFLLSEAGNNNSEAILSLKELADKFSNLSVSLDNLARFIDEQYDLYNADTNV